MRRKDREIKETSEILKVMDECKVCHIALKDDQGLYIVPMNFGYVYKHDQLSLYVHSAKEGRKYSAFHQFPEVAFEMDSGHELVAAQTACAYSYYYQSVMGNGLIHEVKDIQEKEQALSCLMKHQTGKDFVFDEKMAQSVAVFRLDVSSFSGKRH